MGYFFGVLTHVISAVIILTSPFAPGHVLGIQLAQEETAPPPSDSSPPPAEQAVDQSTAVGLTSPPSDEAFGSPADQDVTPLDLTSGTSDTTPPGNLQADLESPSPLPNQGETAPQVAILEQVPLAGEQEINPTLTQDSMAVSAILNSDETIGDPANINEQSVVEIKTEQEKLDLAATPQEAILILIDSAEDKVRDINKFLKSDDLASTNFAALRLTDQINGALDRIQNLPLSQSLPLKAQIVNFCKSADFSLRNLELGVTEESEPDLEIARGACLGTQL